MISRSVSVTWNGARRETGTRIRTRSESGRTSSEPTTAGAIGSNGSGTVSAEATQASDCGESASRRSPFIRPVARARVPLGKNH